MFLIQRSKKEQYLVHSHPNEPPVRAELRHQTVSVKKPIETIHFVTAPTWVVSEDVYIFTNGHVSRLIRFL